MNRHGAIVDKNDTVSENLPDNKALSHKSHNTYEISSADGSSIDGNGYH